MPCSVKNCKNWAKKTKGSGVSYFRIPKNEEIRKQWIDFCERDKLNLENARICSDHFNEECFFKIPDYLMVPGYTPKRRLLSNAVPTLRKKMKTDDNEGSDLRIIVETPSDHNYCKTTINVCMDRQRKNIDEHSLLFKERTLKRDCKAHINIGLSPDGKSLLVKSINNEHNHEIPSLDLFKQLPKQRRLTNEKKKSEETMKVNANNAILLEDLTNISTCSSQKLNYDFGKIVQELKIKYNCTVDVKIEDEKVRAIFFQDVHMKKAFSLFPEIMFLDGTYKLINIRCPVYVMAVENSLGTTDVVGIGILFSEETDCDSIKWMFEKFKERNKDWGNISVVVTDKCANEREAITEMLPNATKLICIFHTLQIFRREITVGKLNITTEEVQTSLHHLQKIVYAKSEEHYNALLEVMKNNVPKSVFKYYMESWHDIRNEWVKGLTEQTENVLNSTNNRLESLSSKLKSTYTTFNEFIDKLFVLLDIKRTQFQNELSKMVFKSPFVVDKTNTELRFCNHITPYAFKQIEENLRDILYSSATAFKYNFIWTGNKVICCTNNNQDAQYEVTPLNCHCCFFTSMKLPCKHILAYRRLIGLDLFDENLFAQRWTRKYIQINNNNNNNNNNTGIISSVETTESLPITETRLSTPISNTIKELTSQEKFTQAEAICLNLATLCGEVSTEEFNKRMKLLTELENKWRNNEEVSLQFANNQDNHFVQNDIEIKCEINDTMNECQDETFCESTIKLEPNYLDDDLNVVNEIIRLVEYKNEDDVEISVENIKSEV